MKLYNTLTRKKEEFVPIKKGKVGMYSCGPTVYWYQHIGNFRTALLADFLKRSLIFNNYDVKHIVNFTDVDDKMIKASQKEGLSLKKLATKYEDIYLSDLERLNIIKPSKFLRATENIDEMVKIIQKLLKKGYAYTTEDGVYFSISKFKHYGEIAGLHKITKTKERIKKDEYDKDNAQDFALWKFYSNEDGDVYWDTPIGKGRPGWHIECSAMSMSELGDNFDIHTGGMDLIFPHHTNEIAQSECASDKKFVNHWVHGGLLNLKQGKMSKSLGNIYTLADLKKEGFDPINYRYLCLQTHYHKPLEFSFDSLTAAKNACEKIERKIIRLRKEKNPGNTDISQFKEEFLDALNDDLNLPKALDVFWRVMEEANMESRTRLSTLEYFDDVLGLGIRNMKEKKIVIPKDVLDLLEERQRARKSKDFEEADKIRDKILKKGFVIEDLAKDGPSLVPI